MERDARKLRSDENARAEARRERRRIRADAVRLLISTFPDGNELGRVTYLRGYLADLEADLSRIRDAA